MTYRRLKNLVQKYEAPDFIIDNLIYLTVGGSRIYGAQGPKSDEDLYAVSVPSKERTLPLFAGEIPGFGMPKKPWLQWEYHANKKDYSCYSVVKFLDLLMKGNPNIIELLFSEEEHILHITEAGRYIRSVRNTFITKRVFPKFIGFAVSKRKSMFKYTDDPKVPYNTKDAYHSARLLLELNQIMDFGTIVNLTKDADMLVSIREGNEDPETLEVMIDMLLAKARVFEKSADNIPNEPNEGYVRGMLLDILEETWGENLDFLRGL